MERLVNFRHNAGLFKVLRILVVASLFTGVSVWTAAELDNLVPLAAWGTGLLLPTLVRKSLMARQYAVQLILDIVWLGLIGSSLVGAYVWDEISDTVPHAFSLFTGGILLVGGAYISTYFWVLSDPRYIDYGEAD
ncbi:MAG: hypothetical protein AAF602_07940 [Myxococcota bacterium]